MQVLDVGHSQEARGRRNVEARAQRPQGVPKGAYDKGVLVPLLIVGQQRISQGFVLALIAAAGGRAVSSW